MATLTPITLSGSTLGARRRHLNALVTQALFENVSLEHIARLPESTPVDRLFKIQLACEGRHADYILQSLRDPDMLYVSTALRSAWLLDAEHSHIINPSYLEDKLYPQMTTPAVNKMKHWIHLNLRDTERCEGFFDYYSKKDFDSAIKFLPHCSNEFILTKVTDILDKLTPHYFKLLSEKCPEVTKIFFDSFSNNEKVLTNYLNKDAQYFNVLRNVLKVRADIVLDITEKYFDHHSFKRFSPEATKYIMNNCKTRFNNKVELYTAWMLDIKTLAKSLEKDEIKDVVLRLARAEYLSGWFSYKNIEPFIKRLSVEERTTFKKQVFVDKTVGDTVQDWPYKPPSRPEGKVSSSDIFQDKEHHPYLHDYPPAYLYRKSCMMKSGYSMARCEMLATPQTALDQLFERYRFIGFDKALFELRKKMTVENLQNRQNMMLVLVSKSGGKPENVEELLKLLMQRHENEPVHLRATVVRSLVKRCSAWRQSQGTWELMLRFGRDLGLDGKPPVAPCIEGLHAVVLRNLLLDCDYDLAIWKAFLKDFSDFKEYSLTVEEQRIVSAKLPALLLRDAEANPSQAIELLQHLLDTLNAYQIPADKFPGVVAAVAATSRQNPDSKQLLHRLFDARIARKELFKENFAIIQNDASYFNALKHKVDILTSGKEFEALLQTSDIRHERFLRALTLYFGEKNGLAEKYLSVLERYADTCPKKQLARSIALLAGDKLMPLIQKLDSFPNKTASRFLSAAIRANIHLSRPLIDLDAIAWQLIGAKAVANHALICSAVNIDSVIKKLLSWRRTNRLALVLSTRVGKEFSTYTTVATSRPKLALKTALWQTRHERKLDSRVWDMVIQLIGKLDVSGINNERLCRALGKVRVVPSDRKAEYCATVFSAFNKISRKAALLILSEIESILPEMDERFIETIIKDFLDNEFTEENLSNVKHDFNESARLYVRIIAKYLLLCKCEKTQTERIQRVGKQFFDRMEPLWSKYGKKNEKESFEILFSRSNKPSDLKCYLNDFVFALKFTKVFLDAEYVSCLPVFESIISRMQMFYPIEHNFSTYVYLHLTMLYFKSIRQSIKNNPEIFNDSPKTLKERVELVGIIFGKYIAREINELKVKYFNSVMDLYKVDLVNYLDEYFNYGFTKDLLLASVMKGILESESNTHLLAEYAYSREYFGGGDCAGTGIMERLKESDAQDVKFFLYADFYCY